MSPTTISAARVAGVHNAPPAFDTDLREAARSFGVAELCVVESDGGVVLEGISSTFYGKQMAQELARKANLVVVANHILVQVAMSRRVRAVDGRAG